MVVNIICGDSVIDGLVVEPVWLHILMVATRSTLVLVVLNGANGASVAKWC